MEHSAVPFLFVLPLIFVIIVTPLRQCSMNNFLNNCLKKKEQKYLIKHYSCPVPNRTTIDVRENRDSFETMLNDHLF